MTGPVPSILIVDDEPHVIHVVRFKLEEAGFNVTVANNGKRAFEVACDIMPDLVITDFQMPGGSGMELVRRLAEHEKTSKLPVIMLTARGHRAPLAELAETNVRSLLAKPFSPRNLLSKVHELLGTQPAEPGATAA